MRKGGQKGGTTGGVILALALAIGIQASVASALELVECSNATGTLRYTALKDNQGKVVLPEAYIAFGDTLPEGAAIADFAKASEVRRDSDAATATTTVYRVVPVRVAIRGSSPAVDDWFFCKTQLSRDPAPARSPAKIAP